MRVYIVLYKELSNSSERKQSNNYSIKCNSNNYKKYMSENEVYNYRFVVCSTSTLSLSMFNSMLPTPVTKE